MNFDIAIITNYEELVKEELVAMKYNYKDYDYVRQLINPPGVAPLDVDPLDVAPPANLAQEKLYGGSIKYKKNKSQKNNIILILNKYKKNKTKKVKD